MTILRRLSQENDKVCDGKFLVSHSGQVAAVPGKEETVQSSADCDSWLCRAVPTVTADCAEQCRLWQLTVQSSADCDSWLCRAVPTVTAECAEQCWQWQLTEEQCRQWQLTAEQCWQWQLTVQSSDDNGCGPSFQHRCCTDSIEIYGKYPPPPPPPSTFVSKRQS